MSGRPSLQLEIGTCYGRLTVIARTKNRGNAAAWRCRCDCGAVKEIAGYLIARGDTVSCGCKRKPHGAHNSRTYRSWASMRARCLNPKSTSYIYYGARGIKIDPRWNCFEAFLADMGLRPLGTSLERIDNAKDYSPKNCKWATPIEQQQNKRNVVLITFHGETRTIRQWSTQLGISLSALRQRYRRGLPPSRILACRV